MDVEIKVREGTRRLLRACRGKLQLLEAAKSLKTSNERISALMTELQNRRQRSFAEKAHESEVPDVVLSHVEPNLPKDDVRHHAQVSLSDLRIPLLWSESEHHRNKGHHRRYALFCLARIGADVQETELVNTVDQSCTDVTFDDVLIL